MNIKWHEPTWYSKLLALIVVLIVVPFLAFHFGQDFENSPLALSPSQQTASVASQVSNLMAMVTQMQSHRYPVRQITPTVRFTRTLKLGGTGSDVVALQNYFISKGFMVGPATKYFGRVTKNAVTAWQKSVGISPASGILDTKSIKFLNSLNSSASSSTYTTTPNPTPTTNPVTTPTPTTPTPILPTPTPVTTGSVNIIFAVDNTLGGTANSSNFKITFTGGNPSPITFAGNTGGMTIPVNAGASYSANALTLVNYKPVNSAGCSGNATAGVTVTCSIIDVYVPPVVSPAASISASPTSIKSSQSSTLSWSSTNATSCTASGGWTGTKTTTGSQSVTPTANTTYTLSCTGSGGTTSQSTSVKVSAVMTTSTTGICEATSSAKCYYIDPTNGNDSMGDGSFSKPWKSFSNLISWYDPSYRPAGWKQLAPGDYIYLFNGTVNARIIEGGWNNTLNISQPNIGVGAIAYFRGVSGSSGNPIHLKNYPGNTPAIGDTMAEPYSPGLDLFVSNWWEVSGIEFRNIPGDCIDASGDVGIKMWNLTVHDCARKDYDGNPAGIKFTGSSYGEVFGSTFYDTFWDPKMNGNPINGTWFLRGAGIQLFEGSNFKIHDNYFTQTKQVTDINGNNVGYAGCMFQKHAQDTTSSTFVVYNNTFNSCGMAFGSGTQNTWFHNNIIINSAIPIEIADFGGTTYEANQLYEYNTIFNGKALTFGPSTSAYNGLYQVLPLNIVFRNNIIYDNATAYNGESNIIDVGTYMDDPTYDATAPQLHISNNCYFNPNTQPSFAIGEANNSGSYGVEGGIYNLAQWQQLSWKGTSLNYDTGSTVSNPLFVNTASNDFHLQTGSACAGMGMYGGTGTVPPP
jgi:hypothetical protein